MKKAIILAAIVIGLASSCSYNNVEDLHSSGCDTTNVTYSEVIEPLMTQSCAFEGCHGGSFPAANLDLNDYDDVKKVADNGLLVNRINRAPGDPLLMPPAGKLPTCNIERIEAWVDAGAPQN
ncbi:hypothetical protein HZ996_12155 [Cryomorphaceae bacterium]|nr:hypothetical protein HZ996_12155 [Cryomorphaceae bacterium]